MRVGLIVAGGLSVVAGGCASMTRGFDEMVHFSSNPAGAEIRTTLGHQCVTPCALKVQRKDEFTATFSKQGFEPQEVLVKTRVAAAGAAGFVGNVLAGGLIGVVVDASSGATLEHCPNPVAVTLRPLDRRGLP